MNPYEDLPSRSFWRTAVAEPDPLSIRDLWRPKFTIGQDDPVLTAGSCFAANIGPVMLESGMNWHIAELPPPGLTSTEQKDRQYGVFSFRTGNIYTAAGLHQWLSWAFENTSPPDEYWMDGKRYYDPFRPSVEPGGYSTAASMEEARDRTLAAIRAGLEKARCLIFTLGLTEAWRNTASKTVYPVCPGTSGGTFDESLHQFHNYTSPEVYQDMVSAIEMARAVNPGLQVLLTVSPVPLTATASKNHVLVATTYSKSVLRAVAGQLAAEYSHVDYFPSYEIVSGFPFKGMFYNENLRTVTPEGVAHVMKHFISAVAPSSQWSADSVNDSGEAHCDDAILDYYNSDA